MAFSLKITLHAKKYSDGTQAVMLQFYTKLTGGRVLKRRTICRVKASQFDRSSGRVKNHPNQILFNSLITQAFQAAEARILTAELEGRPINPDRILALPEANFTPAGMLLAYTKAYIHRCGLKNMHHTAEKYTSHFVRLAQFLGTDKTGQQIDMHMEDVTEDWVLQWANWLRSNGSKSANTIHRRMAFLNTVFTDARKRGIIKSDPMAFLAFKSTKVRKPKLTPDQLASLKAMKLEGREADARNTFLLQFFAYGSRISDALNWKKTDVHQQDDGWYLEYVSIKTQDLISVRLNRQAVDLVQSYLQTVPGEFLLPWLSKFNPIPTLTEPQNKARLLKEISSKTAMVNLQLKILSQRLDFPFRITTHIARHTFATMADSRVTDKRKISAALGHSRFATTETYLADLRQSDVNDAMEAVWQ
ncbi:site-specific integrase [Spirosoma sp. KNUC1025]|uniref:tyrosine-type recombinase/integrase n=1 Tax=Spirosoma sp. KNUC1025 TaxID=2894082 RepID=UPI0038704262|nr:site-specific integrase [Spirosoma sp. KNUC1025]